MGLFRKIFTNNEELMRVQQNVDEAFREQIRQIPLLSGNIIKNASITNGAAGTAINHGLGRPYQGIIVIAQPDASVVFIAQVANPRPEDQIILRGSAATIVTLYVF
jgi:hypothetical protein